MQRLAGLPEIKCTVKQLRSGCHDAEEQYEEIIREQVKIEK
jgi:hypothetical protein